MKKEYDLKKLKKVPGPVKVDPDAAKVHISLRVDASVLAFLRTEAERLGIPYQTHLGSILHQYAHKELVSKTSLDVLRALKAS
jgi:predicted DNA binding CopG/RHH family protein